MKSSSGTADCGWLFLLPMGDEDLVGALGLLGCLPFPGRGFACCCGPRRACFGCRAGVALRRVSSSLSEWPNLHATSPPLHPESGHGRRELQTRPTRTPNRTLRTASTLNTYRASRHSYSAFCIVLCTYRIGTVATLRYVWPCPLHDGSQDAGQQRGLLQRRGCVVAAAKGPADSASDDLAREPVVEQMPSR